MNALLGVQSHFSFHWGIHSPEALFTRAKALGFSYVGIADFASLHALPEIVVRAKDHGIRPIYGASLPLTDNGPVLAMVRDSDGYGNLCELLTNWLDECGADLRHYGGIPFLGGPAAAKFFATHGGLYNGLVFVTGQSALWHSLRRLGCEAYFRIGPVLAAPPPNIPPEMTLFVPETCMIERDDFTTHRLLRAIGAATSLDRIPETARWRAEEQMLPMARPDAVMLSPDQYREVFALYAGAMGRADRLAEELAEFEPSRKTIVPPSPGTDYDEGDSALQQLRELAFDGARQRYGGDSPAAAARLEKELELIGEKGFAEYFLVVHDIVARLAGGGGNVRRGRSVTCGRGSGAASLINYCLGVTNVDVLKHDLIFERFLNPGRFDMPDIDVDFAWDERDDILNRVFDSYGDERVARVANHNRYDWRGAFRAAARCLGYADPEITRRLRQSPEVYAEPGPDLTSSEEAHAFLPDRTARKLARLGRDDTSGWDKAATLARRLQDIPHGVSMHCGGVVISPGPICRLVPTAKSRKGLSTIQWEKDGAEDMGLVKIDLLSNRSLAVIRDVVRQIAEERGIREDEVILGDPTEDSATQHLVATGQTFGVFYLESPSMRLLEAKAGIGDFKHAVIHSSIIRPAANSFINEYVARLRGEPWVENEKELKELFEESYGIPVYQEDAVKLAMVLGKYDYTRADSLRKCLGKRDARERLAAAFPELAAAARANEVSDEAIERCRRVIMSMTGYSFCKPHSASFAQVSYEACYLRAHYPAHFMAAVLSNGGGYYTVQAYVSEAMRLGLRVFGPDVNASQHKWTAEGGDAIRCGFMALSGLSGDLAERVAMERGRDGPYHDLADFYRRLRPNADDVRRLIVAGTFDAIEKGLNRPQIAWLAGMLDREVSAFPYGASENTGTLFNASFIGANSRIPDLPDYTEKERWAAEYAALTFVPGQHPLCLFYDEIEKSAAPYRRRAAPTLIDLGDLPRHVGRLVTFLAWPITAKIVETKHGEAMMFQSFENSHATCESVVFPGEFQKYHKYLGTLQPLWVTGKVVEEFGVATLRVLVVEPVRDGTAVMRQSHVPRTL